MPSIMETLSLATFKIILGPKHLMSWGGVRTGNVINLIKVVVVIVKMTHLKIRHVAERFVKELAHCVAFLDLLGGGEILIIDNLLITSD